MNNTAGRTPNTKAHITPLSTPLHLKMIQPLQMDESEKGSIMAGTVDILVEPVPSAAANARARLRHRTWQFLEPPLRFLGSPGFSLILAIAAMVLAIWIRVHFDQELFADVDGPETHRLGTLMIIAAVLGMCALLHSAFALVASSLHDLVWPICVVLGFLWPTSWCGLMGFASWTNYTAGISIFTVMLVVGVLGNSLYREKMRMLFWAGRGPQATPLAARPFVEAVEARELEPPAAAWVPYRAAFGRGNCDGDDIYPVCYTEASAPAYFVRIARAGLRKRFHRCVVRFDFLASWQPCDFHAF